MKTITLALLTFIGACSTQKTNVSPTRYLELNAEHAQKHKLCQIQDETVLKPAVTEMEDAALDDENYLFVRNESHALAYMNKFDVQKLTLKENYLEYEAMVQGCVEKNDPKYKACETLFSNYKFFRGLIYGMFQYKWSPSTIAKARDVTLSYIQYVADNDYSLMELLFANDLLRRLAERKFITKEIAQDCYLLKDKGEGIYEDLKKEIRKLGQKDLECKDAQKFSAKEHEKVQELARDLRAALVKVSL